MTPREAHEAAMAVFSSDGNEDDMEAALNDLRDSTLAWAADFVRSFDEGWGEHFRPGVGEGLKLAVRIIEITAGNSFDTD